MKNPLDQNRINEIITKRLVRVSSSVRKFLPPILSEPHFSWAILPSDAFLLVVFLSHKDKKRIESLISKNYDPFPGLITFEPSMGAAFRLEKARNTVVQSCAANNTYTLSLGKDATIILADHTQIINTRELGQYQYKISLAYVLSYGDEINEATVYDYLEDLIAYSVNEWRSRNAG